MRSLLAVMVILMQAGLDALNVVILAKDSRCCLCYIVRKTLTVTLCSRDHGENLNDNNNDISPLLNRNGNYCLDQ